MSPAPIHIANERLMLDPAGALFWPATATLVVSDLHLEKGTAFARQGMLLPPWDTHLTLDRLAALLRRWQPRLVLALGDSFHDRQGAARLPRSERERLVQMAATHRFVWVLGNHDPVPPADIPGDFVDCHADGPFVFRHQPGVIGRDRAEVVGHFHPKASVAARGTTICRPCFVTDTRRVMMPALGAYTGGLDIRDPAISQCFPRGGRVFLLGRERLYSFALGPGRRTLPRETA